MGLGVYPTLIVKQLILDRINCFTSDSIEKVHAYNLMKLHERTLQAKLKETKKKGLENLIIQILLVRLLLHLPAAMLIGLHTSLALLMLFLPFLTPL